MNEKDVEILAANYEDILSDEQSLQDELIKAQSAYETEKSRLLNDAYVAGAIDGKNEAARKLQESAVLESSASLDFLNTYAIKRQVELNQVTIERKGIEAKISLTKAWLYSQSGH